MSSTLSPAPADFWDKYHAERSTEVEHAPMDMREQRIVSAPRPPRRRPFRAFFRFAITIALGVGGTLAWQTYGDMAREIAATTYPDQLGWLMPPTPSADSAATPVAAPAVPATVGSAAPAPAFDPQQLNALSLGLAGVRRSVDELAAQIASGQQQMTGDIARLQSSEQDILNKISAPPSRPAAAASGRRSAPVTLTPGGAAAAR